MPRSRNRNSVGGGGGDNNNANKNGNYFGWSSGSGEDKAVYADKPTSGDGAGGGKSGKKYSYLDRDNPEMDAVSSEDPFSRDFNLNDLEVMGGDWARDGGRDAHPLRRVGAVMDRVVDKGGGGGREKRTLEPGDLRQKLKVY